MLYIPADFVLVMVAAGNNERRQARRKVGEDHRTARQQRQRTAQRLMVVEVRDAV